MQKHERLAVAAARREAKEAGLSIMTRRTGKQHLQLIIHTPKGARSTIMGCSPKDRDRQIEKTAAWVRRVVRELTT